MSDSPNGVTGAGPADPVAAADPDVGADADRATDPESLASIRSLPASLSVEDVSTYLFAADRAAPRRKRGGDVIQLLVMAFGFGLLAWIASKEPPIDERVFTLTSDLPDLFRAIGWIGYTGSFLATAAILILMLVRGGIGRGVLRDVIVTVVLVLGFSILAGWLSTEAWPNLAAEFEDEARAVFPGMRTSLILAFVWVLAPYVTAPVQRGFRWITGAALISPLLLGLTTATHLLGAIALAAAVVAAVRLMFGSPEGLPPVDRLGSTLERAGLQVENLAYLDEQPGTVGLASATSVDGRNLSIKIYGEDASRRQRAERIWRAMWYKSSGPTPGAGRIEQAQNESLAMAACQLVDVGAPTLVAAGQDVGGDVVVVSIDPPGRPLHELGAVDLDRDLGRRSWDELAKLHQHARIAHGRIAADTVVSSREHGVAFVDLQQASTLPTSQQLSVDVASFLCTTAIVAGESAAVEAAIEFADRDDLVAALPFLQDAAIHPDLRNSLKRAGIKLGDLRSTLTSALGIEEPELAPIRRVSVGDIVMIVFAILAANALLSQIADVGIDTLREELENASTGWLVAAFLVKLTSYSTAYIGLSAVLTKPIPFAPTTLLQSAKSYVGLVVPSMVGRVGLDIRFLQKQGVSTTVAATQGPVISLIGFIAEVTLLLLSAWAIGQSIETDGLLDADVGGLILLAVLVVVVGIVVVMAVPKLRNAVLPVVKEAFSTMRTIITSPRILARVYSSEFLDRLFGAFALACTCAAFGVDLTVSELIFVSVGTGLLAGIAPVPGGIGVAEATMSALLTAVGVDPALSFSIAIVHRLVTSYLPPILGFFSLDWLTKEGYL